MQYVLHEGKLATALSYVRILCSLYTRSAVFIDGDAKYIVGVGKLIIFGGPVHHSSMKCTHIHSHT